ncbi:BTB/POZ protein [Nemania sp. NC0429]|nr:BTB/POZ protein [Nemania sp. NC0429]
MLTMKALREADCAQEVLATAKAPMPVDQLLISLKRLHSDGDYSDLTIVCKEKHYQVHKCIICPRSGFFAAACRGDFKEAREGKISLPEDDPKAVELMIQFFYHLDYKINAVGTASGDKKLTPLDKETDPLPPCQSSDVKVDSTLMIHAKVYALAQKYLIDDLKTIALRKFANYASRDWNRESFLDVAEAGYELTPESESGLRAAVVETFADHPSLLGKQRMKDILMNADGLAYDLLAYISRTGVFKEIPSTGKSTGKRRYKEYEENDDFYGYL